MIFTNLKFQVANDLGYVDNAGVILTGKDITETDIGNWINNRYLYDLFPALSSQYPEDFIMTAPATNYSRSTTVVSNTTTTLVITDADFVSGDVGNYVYNSTTSEFALITGYTNTTTVTLDAEKGWTALDVIKILEREFSLAGDAVDANVVPRVEIKYSSTEPYKKCELKDYNDLFVSGDEIYSQEHPYYYLTTIKDKDDVKYSAVGIVPILTEPITNAINIRYVEVPAVMSAGTDKPRLPYGFQKLLIIGAEADGYKRLGMINESRALENDYQNLKQMEISIYPLTRAGGPNKIRPSRHISHFYTRSR